MVGPALLIVLVTLAEYGFLRGVLSEDAAGMIGVSILLVLIALAVGMFIYSGSSMERFKYLEKGFNLPYFLRTELEQRRRAYTPTYTLSLALGICLCVVSPVLVIIWAAVSEDTTGYGAAIMLLLIALAVFLFIYYGTIKESFSFLLKEGEYIELPPEKRKRSASWAQSLQLSGRWQPAFF